MMPYNEVPSRYTSLSSQGYTALNVSESEFDSGIELETFEPWDNHYFDRERPETSRWCRYKHRSLAACKCALIIVTFLLAIVTVSVILVGANDEQPRVISRAPTTFSFYNSTQVCAVNRLGGNITSGMPRSFESPKAAHADGFEVAHCGECGECSNWNDMKILSDTKTTLTRRSRVCAAKGFLGGKGAVTDCIKEHVDFTEPCRDCWVDDIQCTFSYCMFTCLKSIYILGESNDHHGSLNSCLECDERMCGPAFIECAGVNRRRLGILTDIHRDDENEQCHDVDINWRKV